MIINIPLYKNIKLTKFVVFQAKVIIHNLQSSYKPFGINIHGKNMKIKYNF